MKPLVLLFVILLATFGAGTVDVMFPDVIPLRPYTGVFSSALTTLTTPWFESSSIFGQVQPQPIVTGFLHLALIGLAILGIWMMFPHPIPMPIPPINLLGSRGSHSHETVRWKRVSRLPQIWRLTQIHGVRLIWTAWFRHRIGKLFPSPVHNVWNRIYK